ncbi:glycosyltransferase BC10-like [Alnus glutinosa]|uniref:glycosyltransferase BC10-like n=1 Tax=Alnus glutinosa TaxID=3517 RepID=UPI002D770DF6|nr:glycosyltransferase BC10-like [Alnus glutinosa]
MAKTKGNSPEAVLIQTIESYNFKLSGWAAGKYEVPDMVGWGESSMIAAEKLLLEATLEDPANQRFVLLSDSCVPLYNFSYIYNYVMYSPRSLMDSFLDKKEGRYNPKMSPIIPKEKWRKGSQWITLVRSHAEVIVDDEDILSVFKKFCKRRPPVDAR